MRDCFELRFNLYKMANPDLVKPANPIKATVGLFGFDEKMLEECLNDFEKSIFDSALKLYERVKNTVKALQDKSIAFFGDSITSERLSYAKIIKESKIFKDVEEYAISGNTTMHLSLNMPKQLNKKESDIAIVFVGTNDMDFVGENKRLISINEYKENLDFIATTIQEHNMYGVFITCPYLGHQKGIDRKENTDLYDSVIINTAKKYNFSLLETRDFLYQEGEFHEPDEGHLNPVAQEILANKLIDLLIQDFQNGDRK